VLAVDFSGSEIRLRLAGIGTAAAAELIFRFDAPLQEAFPNKDVFDRALRSSFTEGLKYTDIENAKTGFIQEQFDRALEEIASTTSTNRETVLKVIVPGLPAYQDSQREIENLRNRNHDISAQLNQAQADNKKVDVDSKAQLAEIARLKNANNALQEKIENSSTQVSRLGEELKDVKGNTQGYQKELASIQRSLNIRIDANRDLASQISDLGQAMRKLQKENENMGTQINTLRSSLDAQQKANARLSGENDDLKAGNKKMQSTIAALTSTEDSLGKKYLTLKNEKEKFDAYMQTAKALRAEIVEETVEGGARSGKAKVYLKNVLLGTIDWRLPTQASPGEDKQLEAAFSMESINLVKVSSEERQFLRSLGDKLKVRIDAASASELMQITPEKPAGIHEVGEREHSDWRWNLVNKGTQDSRLVLSARLINRDSNELLLFRQDYSVASSNVIRQAREQLKLIPIAIGAVLGFVLFGIATIFRKPRKQHSVQTEKLRAYDDKKEL